jgi:hypothetical protein
MLVMAVPTSTLLVRRPHTLAVIDEIDEVFIHIDH